LTLQSVALDFEIAAFQEVQAAFPNVLLFGCLFHLTRNMKKKLTEQQLMSRYNSDAEFALQARMVVAVAFVPIASVEAALEVLSDAQDGISADLHPIIDLEDRALASRLELS